MEKHDPRIDAAARHLRETLQAGKRLTPWDQTPKATKKKWIVLATGTLEAADVAAWRPVEEATEDMMEDLLNLSNGVEVSTGYYDTYTRVWRWWDDRQCAPQPTHFTPLPAAPAAPSEPA